MVKFLNYPQTSITGSDHENIKAPFYLYIGHHQHTPLILFLQEG